MTKKITTISIDEDVLRLAKKEIPNLSIWVEDLLRTYLGFNNTNIKSIDENLQTIKDCLLAIELQSRMDTEAEAVESFSTEQQQKQWSNLFGLYRKGVNIDLDIWEQTSKMLNVSVRELQELIEVIDFEVDKSDIVKCNDWSYVKKYLK